MARKVKCQICKQGGTNEDFYKVTVGNRNFYYCNQAEYEKHEQDKIIRDKIFRKIAVIWRLRSFELLPPIMKKEINKLADIYNYETVKIAIERAEQDLTYWMNVENKFTSDYNKTTYFIAILKGSYMNSAYEENNHKQNTQKEIEQEVNKEEINNLNNIDTIVKTPTSRNILDFL